LWGGGGELEEKKTGGERLITLGRTGSEPCYDSKAKHEPEKGQRGDGMGIQKKLDD